MTVSCRSPRCIFGTDLEVRLLALSMIGSNSVWIIAMPDLLAAQYSGASLPTLAVNTQYGPA